MTILFVLLHEEAPGFSALNQVFTAHIRGMKKVLFSQVSVCPRGGGYPLSQALSHVSSPRSFLGGGTSVPGSLPGLWSQVISQGYQSLQWIPQDRIPPGQDRTGATPWPGLRYPPAQTEQQSEYLLRYGRYASCGRTGGLSCLQLVYCELVLPFQLLHPEMAVLYSDKT